MVAKKTRYFLSYKVTIPEGAKKIKQKKIKTAAENCSYFIPETLFLKILTVKIY